MLRVLFILLILDIKHFTRKCIDPFDLKPFPDFGISPGFIIIYYYYSGPHMYYKFLLLNKLFLYNVT